MRVVSEDRKQGIRVIELTKLEDSLTDFVLFKKLPVKEAAKELGLPVEKVREGYIGVLSTMYGEAAAGIVDRQF